MRFRVVGGVFCLYVSGVSTLGFKKSRTVGTCDGWKRGAGAKGIGTQVMIFWILHYELRCTTVQRVREYY